MKIPFSLCLGLSFLGISFLFVGCGSPFETSDAETIIKGWYPQKSDAYSIAIVEGAQTIDKYQLESLDELSTLRLIDYQVNGIQPRDMELRSIYLKITDKGKPYIESTGPNSKMFLLVHEEFVQVTGVTQKGNYARAEYTTKYEPEAPFTEADLEKLAPESLQEVVRHTSSFMKDKNGWKEVPIP